MLRLNKNTLFLGMVLLSQIFTTPMFSVNGQGLQLQENILLDTPGLMVASRSDSSIAFFDYTESVRVALSNYIINGDTPLNSSDTINVLIEFISDASQEVQTQAMTPAALLQAIRDFAVIARESYPDLEVRARAQSIRVAAEAVRFNIDID